MKSIRGHASTFFTTLAFAGLFFLVAPKLFAQRSENTEGGATVNPPPCDYNDTFYMDNGVDPTEVQGRFGSARQFGPPARSSIQPKWIADSTCLTYDPKRRNFRVVITMS